MLKLTFIQLATQYTSDTILIKNIWEEIESSYAKKDRYYHSLTHLNNLLNELLLVKQKIIDWDCILFSLYFHDIVYNTLKSNNEEKSAEIARLRMLSMGVPLSTIEKCVHQIISTKTHVLSNDSDTNYFTDADLSILGSNNSTYTNYTIQIRKEYSIYPNIIYNAGRKKVVEHFLTLNPIFKTDYFFDKFEQQAIGNLQTELKTF
jgi:predicted metal-dependent HD superfamily phosphohydrolase